MKKTKKVIKVLTDTLMTIILVCGLGFIVAYLAGIEPYVIKTGSMRPGIEPGSLSFINKNVVYDDIKVNDIIAFSIPTGDKVTHRVVNITEEGFETKGDMNDSKDGIVTTRNNFIGKNIFTIPKLGQLVNFIQTVYGKIILIVIIILILVNGFLSDVGKNGKRYKSE